jgi:2'-5' RNA ligase
MVAIDLRRHFELQGAGFRPMEPQDVHVTVLFCGEGLHSLPLGLLGDLRTKLAVICSAAGSSSDSLSMQFAGLEFFPPAKRNLVVARFVPSAGLARLRAAVVAAAADAGVVSAAAVAAEGAWLPHATLGKLRASKADLAKLTLPAAAMQQGFGAPVGLRLVGAPEGRAQLVWRLPFFATAAEPAAESEPADGQQRLAKLAVPQWKARSEATAGRNLTVLAASGGCPAAVIMGDSMTERLVDPPPAEFCGGVECRPAALEQSSGCFVFSAGGDKIGNLTYRLQLAAEAGVFATTEKFVLMCGINNILYTVVTKKKNWRKKAEAAAATLPCEIVAGLQSVVELVGGLAAAGPGGREPPAVSVCELLPVLEADCDTFKAEQAAAVNAMVRAVNQLLPTLRGCKVVQMLPLPAEAYLPDCLHLSPAGNLAVARRLSGAIADAHSGCTQPGITEEEERAALMQHSSTARRRAADVARAVAEDAATLMNAELPTTQAAAKPQQKNKKKAKKKHDLHDVSAAVTMADDDGCAGGGGLGDSGVRLIRQSSAEERQRRRAAEAAAKHADEQTAAMELELMRTERELAAAAAAATTMAAAAAPMEPEPEPEPEASVFDPYSVAYGASPSQPGVEVFSGEYDEEGVWVYQAYSTEIADWAVANQQLGGPRFNPSRMTWFKPSFAWVLYRSGYARKHNQERVLKLKLGHASLAALLSLCKCKHGGGGSKGRVQWDPARDIMRSEDGKVPSQLLHRRAIQVGVRADLSERFVEAVLAVEDVTALAHQVGEAHRQMVQNTRARWQDRSLPVTMEQLLPSLPRERPYRPHCSETVLRELRMLPGKELEDGA